MAGIIDTLKNAGATAGDEIMRGVKMVGRDLGLNKGEESYIPKERIIRSADKKNFAGTDTQGNLRMGSIKTEKEEGYKKGGKVGSASKRADGIAQKGKTRGTIVMCGGGYMKGKK
jgi:hypothetical protein